MVSIPSNNKDISVKLHKLTCVLGRIAAHELHVQLDLTFSQFRMLMALRKRGQVTQKHIARFHGLTEAAVSRQIEILHEKKLILRTENQNNRRERMLTLTKEGHATAEKAIKTINEQLSTLFGVLSAKQKNDFEVSLEKLLASAETKEEKFTLAS